MYAVSRYVRLELLEGVVAYHSGQADSARTSLLSAQEKFEQVPAHLRTVAIIIHSVHVIFFIFHLHTDFIGATQLQLSDEQVAALAQMGFSMKEARRSLRVSGKDASRAVEFVMNERAKAQEKAEEDNRRQEERRSVIPSNF